MKYSLDTGLTQAICPIGDFFGGSWSERGEIVFSGTAAEGLWRVPARGGSPEQLLGSAASEGEGMRRLFWPYLLPGGSHALATTWGDRLVVVDLEAGEIEPLGIDGVRAFFPGGRDLFYTNTEGTLLKVAFDAARRRIRGTPEAVLDGISRTRFATPVLDISRTGTLLYARGFVQGSGIVPNELVHLDANGSETVLPFEPQLVARGFALSPTGDRLVVGMADDSIWIFDLERGTRMKLPRAADVYPWNVAWAPDASRISFGGITGDGTWAVYDQPVDGGSEPVVLHAEEAGEIYLGSWGPDGQDLVYCHLESSGANSSVRILSRDGSEPRVVARDLQYALSPSFSPDGAWLTYESADTGDFEVYVQSPSGSGRRIVVSSGGGRTPRWSPDGRELYYRSGDRLMAVAVPPPPGQSFGRPREVLRTDTGGRFCVDPRGGFYGYRPVPGEGIRTSLKLVLHWSDPGKPLD